MHISREGLYQSCIKIDEISNFRFLNFVFVFINMDPLGEKKLQTTSCLKVHNRFALQNSGILLRRVSTKFVKRIVNFQIWIFGIFFVLFAAFNLGVNGEL